MSSFSHVKVSISNDLLLPSNEAKFFFGDAQFIEREEEYFQNIYAIESAFHFANKKKFIQNKSKT